MLSALWNSLAAGSGGSAVNDIPSSPAVPDTPSTAPIPFLKEDILINIAGHLDLSSAPNLAKAHPICALACRYRIWRDIDLTVPVRDTRPAWAEDQIRRDKAVLEARAWGVWGQLEEKGKLIKTLSWSAQVLSTEVVWEILSDSGRYIESITVLSTESRLDKADLFRPTFDIILLAPKLSSFAKLTTLLLGSDSAKTPNFLPDLFKSASALTALDVCIDLRTTPSDDLPVDMSSPRRLLTTQTLLQRLRIVISNPDTIAHPFSGSDGYRPATDSLETILSLLRLSTALEQLSLDYKPPYHDRADAILGALDSLHRLSDLRWANLDRAATRSIPRLAAPGAGPCGGKVRRLTLEYNLWTLPTYEWRGLESVETLVLDCTVRPDHPQAFKLDVNDFFLRALAQRGFAKWLLRHPKLSRIFYLGNVPNGNTLQAFDPLVGLERTDIPTVMIRSYRHGEEECLHVSVLLQAIDEESRHSGGSRPRFLYTARHPLFAKYQSFSEYPLVWRYTTYYKRPNDPAGARTSVPSAVLERMRVVEGLSEKEWGNRGVEVGAMAWQVLRESRAV